MLRTRNTESNNGTSTSESRNTPKFGPKFEQPRINAARSQERHRLRPSFTHKRHISSGRAEYYSTEENSFSLSMVLRISDDSAPLLLLGGETQTLKSASFQGIIQVKSHRYANITLIITCKKNLYYLDTPQPD